MRLIKQYWPEMVFSLFLLAGLLGLYSVGFGHKLIFDDAWISRSPEILSAPISVGLHFRSLWTASYQFIYQFVGAELYWQRVFNALLHGINALLIWRLTALLVRRALEQEAAMNRVDGGAETGADRQTLERIAIPVAIAIWAFNPVAVYAVQYLTQRSTLMATGFLVAALLAFITVLQSRSMVRRMVALTATFILYLLAILSKEHAAPGVALLLPLYIYWQRPNRKHLWLGGGVLLALIVVAAVLLVAKKRWVIGAATEDLVAPFLKQLDALRPGASEQVYALSVINQLWLFFRYGFLWVVPWVTWLSVDLRPPFPLEWYALPQILGVVAYLAIVLVAVVAVLTRRGRIALLGLAVLVPAMLFTTELAFVRLQEPFVLYRSYLWSLSMPIMYSMAMLALIRQPQWIVAIGLVVPALFAALSLDRIQSLRDDRSAWADALEKQDKSAPPNALGRWRAPHNLARWDLTERRFEQALINGRLADELGAPDGLAKQKIGSALVSLRRPHEALPVLIAAQEEGYKGVEIWVSIGGALDQLGRLDEASDAYDRALQGDLHERFRPATLLAAGNLANRMGKYDRAQRYFEELIKLQPSLVPAVVGLATARVRQGDVRGGELILTSAIDRQPDAGLFYARASIYLQLGRHREAMRDIEQALSREPHNPVYLAAKREILRGMVSNGG